MWELSYELSDVLEICLYLIWSIRFDDPHESECNCCNTEKREGRRAALKFSWPMEKMRDKVSKIMPGSGHLVITMCHQGNHFLTSYYQSHAVEWERCLLWPWSHLHSLRGHRLGGASLHWQGPLLLPLRFRPVEARRSRLTPPMVSF